MKFSQKIIMAVSKGVEQILGRGHDPGLKDEVRTFEENFLLRHQLLVSGSVPDSLLMSLFLCVDQN